jgi:hypothetical protein
MGMSPAKPWYEPPPPPSPTIMKIRKFMRLTRAEHYFRWFVGSVIVYQAYRYMTFVPSEGERRFMELKLEKEGVKPPNKR